MTEFLQVRHKRLKKALQDIVQLPPDLKIQVAQRIALEALQGAVF